VTSPLIESLRRAVEAAPNDVELRIHLAEQLLAAGGRDEAVMQAAGALQREPGNIAAQRLMARALAGEPQGAAPASGFDWRAAEQQVGDVAAPMFVDDGMASTPSPRQSGAARRTCWAYLRHSPGGHLSRLS